MIIIVYLIGVVILVIAAFVLIWLARKFNDYTKMRVSIDENENDEEKEKALRIIRSNYKYWNR